MFGNIKMDLKISNRIEQEDPYIYMDFLKEFKPTFNSLDELSTAFIKKFPRVFAKIHFQSGYYLKKDTQTDLFSRLIKLPPLIFTYNDKVIIKGKIIDKITEVNMIGLIDYAGEDIPTFSKETFRPCDHKLGKYEYNTWTGFKSEEKDLEMDMSYVNPILAFIKTVICDNNDEVFRYLISWLRHIIITPYKKTGVAIFLHSDEKGTGKSSLGNWLKNYLFGGHISNIVSGLSKLTQKHNILSNRNIFTAVEELPSVQGEFHAQFDIMKHLITDSQTTIEPKGVDPYEVENMTNFFMLSNNLMSLKLEKGDRRYACIEVSPCKKLDEDYWDDIHDNVLTEESAKHFCKYLQSIPKEDAVSLRKIPKTKLRETMIANSIPSNERFFSDVNNDDFEIPMGAYVEAFTVNDQLITKGIKFKVLYKLYESYCTESRESCMRKKLFKNACKNRITEHRNMIDGKNVRYCLIN